MVVLRDYLKNRHLLYETTEGPTEIKVTSGAAQGSIGPDLWYVSYDSLLETEMHPGAFLVGYADDVAAVITARMPDMAQLILNGVVARIGAWMQDHGLTLAIAKTEIVMLTRNRIPTLKPMTVGTEVVQTKRSARYLGVWLDTKLTFWEQIRQACDKAAKVTAKLSRLMSNVGGPCQKSRRLLMASVQSVLLFGAEIWADAMRVRKYRTRMLAVQRRGALRVTSSYHTVSEPAVLVVGVVSIDLLAIERKRCPE